MISVNEQRILAVSMPIEWREFTRYFSGFPITSLDQHVVCLHKKQIAQRNWKEIWAGMEIFLCRDKEMPEELQNELLGITSDYAKPLLRGEIIQWFQVHVPLTGEFLGKEEEFTKIVSDFRSRGYVIVQSIIQTKDFPLIQWSITDPSLVELLAKQIENSAESPIVQTIGPKERRDSIVTQLVDWLEENGYDASLCEQYDIAVITCDG